VYEAFIVGTVYILRAKTNDCHYTSCMTLKLPVLRCQIGQGSTLLTFGRHLVGPEDQMGDAIRFDSQVLIARERNHGRNQVIVYSTSGRINAMTQLGETSGK
jgi:hypothetical protein